MNTIINEKTDDLIITVTKPANPHNQDYEIYYAYALTRIGEGKGSKWSPSASEMHLAHVRAIDRLPQHMEKAREWAKENNLI